MDKKEIKHTDGPWHVPFDHSTTVVQNAVGQCVADTDSNMYIAFRAKQANARLIAAAPELLEACKKALVAMRVLGWDQTTTACLKNDWETVVAAIANAQGGAK